MKVLVAFDGSAGSKRALAQAVQLARRFDASLTLAYVVPPMLPVLGDYSGVRIELQERMRKDGERLVEEQAAVLRQDGLRADTVVREGPPAEQLVELSKDAEVGYVVVGASGHGVLAHALLGSVVSKLLHLCTRPVLVVH